MAFHHWAVQLIMSEVMMMVFMVTVVVVFMVTVMMVFDIASFCGCQWIALVSFCVLHATGSVLFGCVTHSSCSFSCLFKFIWNFFYYYYYQSSLFKTACLLQYDGFCFTLSVYMYSLLLQLEKFLEVYFCEIFFFFFLCHLNILFQNSS